jgi:phosphatidylethanolamine-binding protein (PEBP) family uncharacterized protein
MKAVKYALCTVLAVLVVGIAGVLLRAAQARRADSAFHAGLARNLVVRSDTFSAATDIPAAYTCRGRGLSPQLAWDAAPAGTLSYAITAVDGDVPAPVFPAGNFTHWVLYDISPVCGASMGASAVRRWAS